MSGHLHYTGDLNSHWIVGRINPRVNITFLTLPGIESRSSTP